MKIRPLHIWFLVAVVWGYVATTAYHIQKPAQDLQKRINGARMVS